MPAHGSSFTWSRHAALTQPPQIWKPRHQLSASRRIHSVRAGSRSQGMASPPHRLQPGAAMGAGPPGARRARGGMEAEAPGTGGPAGSAGRGEGGGGGGRGARGGRNAAGPPATPRAARRPSAAAPTNLRLPGGGSAPGPATLCPSPRRGGAGSGARRGPAGPRPGPPAGGAMPPKRQSACGDRPCWHCAKPAWRRKMLGARRRRAEARRDYLEWMRRRRGMPALDDAAPAEPAAAARSPTARPLAAGRAGADQGTPAPGAAAAAGDQTPSWRAPLPLGRRRCWTRRPPRGRRRAAAARVPWT